MFQRFKQFTFTILLLCGVKTSSIYAQQIDTVKLNEFFDALLDNNEAMGSIAIAYKGKPIYQRSIGYSYINGSEHNKATANTRYRVASITKIFTATLIFQLIEENKLSLETTIDKFFTQVPNASKITVADLLYHRSGLANFSTNFSWRLSPKTEDELLDMIAKSKINFEPDSSTEYSNTNYWLLGFIIERLYKKDFAEVLKNHITDPLGLKNTYYGNEETDIKNNESYSYWLMDSTWTKYPETTMSTLRAAGGIMSTPSDLCVFINALFNGKLISNNSLGEMTTLKDKLGMGLMPAPFDGHQGYGHTGRMDGFFSCLNYYPDDNLTVAYCSNGCMYGIGNIVATALKVYFKKPYKTTDFKYIIKNEEAILDKYVGSYTSDDVPVEVRISRRERTLWVEIKGQPLYPLTPVLSNNFAYYGSKTSFYVIFDALQHTMTYHQNGRKFHYIWKG